jgi:foldase protein PrsA
LKNKIVKKIPRKKAHSNTNVEKHPPKAHEKNHSKKAETHTRTTHRTHTPKKKEVRLNKKNLLNLLAVTIIVLLLLSSALFIYVQINEIKSSKNSVINFFANINNKYFANEEEVPLMAVVNGNAISIEELDVRYERLPPQLKQMITKEQYMDQLIDEELLVQEAMDRGYDVTSEEIKESLSILAEQAGVNLLDLEDILAEQNISIDELEEIYKRERLITKLINDSVINQVSLIDEEIEKYYEDNSETFVIPEAIKVNHLIICHEESVRCESNRTKEEAIEFAKLVYGYIDESNFIEVVKQYSEEPNADVSGGALEGPSLQGYVTKADPFDQVFLEEAFKLNAGEYSEPVETVFGIHIIKVFEKKEEGNLPFEDVKEEINFTLTTETQRTIFTEMLEGIRDVAVITRFDDME